jgi:23S rRNA pseudouridine2605 synthase
MEERLQKILAQAGLGSRRDCEELILAGRVKVNGGVAVIGQKADPAIDKISFDGNAIKTLERKVYIALHKPRMVLSTVEAEPNDTRKTVRDLVPVSERLYPVGRLDFDSEGLILMTNDGDMANELTHPSKGHTKEYRVLLARHPDEEQLSIWRRGVVLEDGFKTAPAEVRIEAAAGKGIWVRIVMHEGRKRQIREIGSQLGLPVVRIVRVRIGTLRLGMLKAGEWRYLTAEEIAELQGKRPAAGSRPKTIRTAAGVKRPARPAGRWSDDKTRTGGRKPPPGDARPAGRVSDEKPGAGRRRPPEDKRPARPMGTRTDEKPGGGNKRRPPTTAVKKKKSWD